MRARHWVALALVYATVGFRTFGWRYNHDTANGWEGQRQLQAMMSCIFWPIYWAGDVAIRVAK